MQTPNAELSRKIKELSPFVGDAQLKVLYTMALGEEYEEGLRILSKLHDTILTMPKSYESDGQGDKAIAHLHYFNPSSDAYITERDMEDEQQQAFGLMSLNGNPPELGYINLKELTDNGFEIDCHYEPISLAEIRHNIEAQMACDMGM